MKRLSDFKPLKLVELPDIGTVSGLGPDAHRRTKLGGEDAVTQRPEFAALWRPSKHRGGEAHWLNKPEYQPYFESAPPVTELHSLRVDDAASGELAAETVNTFGKAVWPDRARGDSLSLRVADGDLPSPDDRLSFAKMLGYRTIEDEGDGLKSYVSICIALLLGLRPVCLIDEPEMCLHPPQAYSLGRFIGKHAELNETATFVATHSAQILRGVLQSTRDVEIIRLSRTGNQFHAHRVSADKLALALAKPTLRAETILDGIFSEAIVIVEADGDRLVYHTTWETLAQECAG